MSILSRFAQAHNTRASMAYLAKQYNIKSRVAVVELTPDEAILEKSLGDMMELLDSHQAFWEKRVHARKTNQALTTARALVAGLLTALHSKENRLARTIAAIYKKDLKSLVRAMRVPVGREDDRRIQQFRQQVMEDRGTFRNKLEGLVLTMRDMLKEDLESETYQAVLHEPAEEIQRYLNVVANDVHAIIIEEDVANADGDAIDDNYVAQ